MTAQLRRTQGSGQGSLRPLTVSRGRILQSVQKYAAAKAFRYFQGLIRSS